MVKNLISWLGAVGIAHVVMAQPVPQFAHLDSATVYVQGAELLHHARVHVTEGANEFRIAGIARNLDEQSLRIDLPDGVSLLSVQQVASDADQPQVFDHPDYRKLADRIKQAKHQLEDLRNRQLAEEGTLTLLDENQQLAGKQTNPSIDELKRYIAYYKQERLAARGRISGLKAAQQRTLTQLDSLEKTLNAAGAALGNNGGMLALQLYAERPAEASIAIRYLTPEAGWSASYDLRVDDISAPLSLVYKAQVWQQTGVDWKQVALTLATGAPANPGTLPAFDPWYVHVLAPQPVYNEVARATMEVEEMAVDEAVSSASKRNAYAAMPMQVQEGQLNLRFRPSVPYNVAADGQPHGVVLQQVTHPAHYQYYAAPKFSNNAFLVAEITDYRKLNLLPGGANLVVENAYVGQTTVNPVQTEDTLRLSMGRDERVAISRLRVDEHRASQWIGNQQSQTFTYAITVRNNKSAPIALTLEEPYPLSADDKIRVKLLETGGGENDRERGRLKWKMALAPGESKTVRVGYEVRYPKGTQVNL